MAMAPDESLAETPISKERETQSTASPKLAPVEDSPGASEMIPRPDDPVPMSLDSDGPVQESLPSDESLTELYDRACGSTASDDRKGGREKRPRSPDFIPGKRMKQDALRLPFVDNKGILKAHCTHHLATIDGAQTLAGVESALTAWVAARCERPLG